MSCRWRNNNGYDICCSNKRFAVWAVEHINEFMFRMLLRHAVKYFICIMTVSFEMVFLEKNRIYCNSHKAKVAAIFPIMLKSVAKSETLLILPIIVTL